MNELMKTKGKSSGYGNQPIRAQEAYPVNTFTPIGGQESNHLNRYPPMGTKENNDAVKNPPIGEKEEFEDEDFVDIDVDKRGCKYDIKKL